MELQEWTRVRRQPTAGASRRGTRPGRTPQTKSPENAQELARWQELRRAASEDRSLPRRARRLARSSGAWRSPRRIYFPNDACRTGRLSASSGCPYNDRRATRRGSAESQNIAPFVEHNLMGPEASGSRKSDGRSDRPRRPTSTWGPGLEISVRPNCRKGSLFPVRDLLGSRKKVLIVFCGHLAALAGRCGNTEADGTEGVCSRWPKLQLWQDALPSSNAGRSRNKLSRQVQTNLCTA